MLFCGAAFGSGGDSGCINSLRVVVFSFWCEFLLCVGRSVFCFGSAVVVDCFLFVQVVEVCTAYFGCTDIQQSRPPSPILYRV